MFHSALYSIVDMLKPMTHDWSLILCGCVCRGVCVCVCVCVCVPPWTKGLTPPLFPFYTGRGAVDHHHSLPNEDSDGSVVKQCGTPHCVPAEFSPCCDSTFHVFGSWFFMILPQNLPFAAFVLQLGRADRSFSRLDQQLVETPTSLSDSSPCRSIAFLPCRSHRDNCVN